MTQGLDQGALIEDQTLYNTNGPQNWLAGNWLHSKADIYMTQGLDQRAPIEDWGSNPLQYKWSIKLTS